jgi:hypothetical protein
MGMIKFLILYNQQQGTPPLIYTAVVDEEQRDTTDGALITIYISFSAQILLSFGCAEWESPSELIFTHHIISFCRFLLMLSNLEKGLTMNKLLLLRECKTCKRFLG